MNRTGLLITLIAAVATGLVFGIWPQLDIALSAAFYDSASGLFPLKLAPLAETLRGSAGWVMRLIAFASIVALVVKLAAPRRRMLLPGRAVLLLLPTLLVGPGLLVNAILKDHWGRPRPVAVTQFNGEHKFVAWWDTGGTCSQNCSFVSGEVSSAAWTLAAAAVVPAPWRAVAYVAALALTAGAALLRIAVGGHFVSDAIFAMLLTVLVIWVAHGLIYRWPATRLTDESIEAALERASRATRAAAARALAWIA